MYIDTNKILLLLLDAARYNEITNSLNGQIFNLTERSNVLTFMVNDNKQKYVKGLIYFYT